MRPDVTDRRVNAYLARLRESPVAILTWIEAAAALCATLFDAGDLAFVSPYDALLHPLPLAWGGLVTAVCAAAIFTIPHRPNRRYISVVVAVCTLSLAGYLPPHGIVPIVLASILASRLVFAYGLAGALVAWIAGSVSIGFRVLAQTQGVPEADVLLTQIYYLGTWTTVLGLLSGFLSFGAYYAKTSAASAAVKERSRIALDLHDALGHGLTTLSVQLESAQRLRGADASKADEYVRLAIGTTASLLADVRETVGLLLEKPESPEPFSVLVERLFADFAATHAATVRWTVSLEREPAGAVSLALYRVAQEALTNVARHARATNVNASMKADAREITVEVADDGCGAAEANQGNGLRSMRERVTSVGGSLTIETRAGRGTTIRACVPLSDQS